MNDTTPMKIQMMFRYLLTICAITFSISHLSVVFAKEEITQSDARKVIELHLNRLKIPVDGPIEKLYANDPDIGLSMSFFKKNGLNPEVIRINRSGFTEFNFEKINIPYIDVKTSILSNQGGVGHIWRYRVAHENGRVVIVPVGVSDGFVNVYKELKDLDKKDSTILKLNARAQKEEAAKRNQKQSRQLTDLCEAQKQTCLAQCQGAGSCGIGSDDSCMRFVRCESSCRNISCN